MFNKVKKILYSKKGFTLVEVLVASAVSSIILIGTLTLVLPTMNNIRKTSQINDSKMLSDRVIELISKEVKYSDSITIYQGTPPAIPATDEKIIYFEPHDPTDTNSVILLKKKNDAGVVTDLIVPDDFGVSLRSEFLFNVDGSALSVTIDSETLIGQDIFTATKVVKSYNCDAEYDGAITQNGTYLIIK